MLQDKLNTIIIGLWGTEVGAVTLREHDCAVFEYTDTMRNATFDVSPIAMPAKVQELNPLSNNVAVSAYTFPALNQNSFKGLPGLLAESLPGAFSEAMQNEHRVRQGRTQNQHNPVDMLLSLGSCGMGALEFVPVNNDSRDATLDDVVPIHIEDLVTSLRPVLHDRGQMQLSLSDEDDEASEKAFHDLLRVTAFTRGTQPKAIIAINEKTGEMLSGQGVVPDDYDHWLLKFDDVDDANLSASRLIGSKQATRVEYAYALMAKAAKINISECRLLEENDRAHFITRRFDRRRNQNSESNVSSKIHTQSLFALAHYDYAQSGVYSYEQAFEIMRQLHLPKSTSLELYRRMLFNVFARNQNDHTKNISFLMDEAGKWKLAPAYNLTYAYNPDGHNHQHQMSINGKCDNFTREDLTAVGESLSLPKVGRIIDEVKEAVSQWSTFARLAGVKKKVISDISKMHRLDS